jgi:glycosyltransferase involved in cell wall biosynthesis
VADCLQRYVPECFSPEFARIQSNVVLPFLRTAQFLLATTPSTAGDLNTYVGVSRDRIVRIPMFVDSTLQRIPSNPVDARPYFLWVTNLAPHKNHSRVVQALRKYYERGGQVDCVIVGTLTDALRQDSPPPSEGLLDYIARIKQELHASSSVSSHLRIAGELSDRDYCRTLQGATFLLQANLYDNGCFATVDAACLGVPSLCAGYPAQDFINQTFRLDALRFDPHDAESLADGLLRMETGANQRSLPSREQLDQYHWQTLAPQFYETILSRLSPIHGQSRDAYR